MEWTDIFPVIVLAVCVLAVHEDRKNVSGSTLVPFLVGLLVWGWIGFTLFSDYLADDAGPLDTVDEGGALLRLAAFVGALIWFVVAFHDPPARPSRPSRPSGGGASAARERGTTLTTADGARVDVGNGVWSQNHWPWSIASVEEGWVHLEYDWDDSEQSSAMIAVEDFGRYYYLRHPSGPMSCYTAGCRHRPWGVR